MKLLIPNFTDNPNNFLRSCGYAFDKLSTGAFDKLSADVFDDSAHSTNSGQASSPQAVRRGSPQANEEMAFVRRLAGTDYPRFHIYCRIEKIRNGPNPLVQQSSPQVTTSGSTPLTTSGSTPLTTSGSTPLTTSGSTPLTTSGSTPLTTSGSTPLTTSPKFEIRNLIINLHLDQKEPSYKGASAHSGEYGGELVEEEIRRIEKLSKNIISTIPKKLDPW